MKWVNSQLNVELWGFSYHRQNKVNDKKKMWTHVRWQRSEQDGHREVTKMTLFPIIFPVEYTRSMCSHDSCGIFRHDIVTDTSYDSLCTGYLGFFSSSSRVSFSNESICMCVCVRVCMKFNTKSNDFCE